ncbi:hypothetical protein [Oceaniglobus indicus]|uniref:hypothetical protein n=1 Tax=Oceaniglobus indicus TaxID=2047749 RepID=UPI000C197F74|nr:hypothetical protein [Oceaniglobus indicus]
MFHASIHPADITNPASGDVAFRRFLLSHSEPLGHAAVLLGGRRGARLINAIREGLGQTGSLTRRLRGLLLELRDLLFLEHAHSDDWDDYGCLPVLEPDDPMIPELCLLADGLEEALRLAGVISTNSWVA